MDTPHRNISNLRCAIFRSCRIFCDLREEDFEMACGNLGLDYDYVEYFINRVAMA